MIGVSKAFRRKEPSSGPEAGFFKNNGVLKKAISINGDPSPCRSVCRLGGVQWGLVRANSGGWC